MKRIWIVYIFSCLLIISNYTYLSWCSPNYVDSPIEQLKSFQKQLSIDSTRVDIRLKLAKVYLQIENYTKAISEYNQIISSVEINPKNLSTLTDVHYGLGLAYNGLEKFDKAIDEFQIAIQITPDRAHIHAAKGAAHASLHQYKNALESYLVANKIQPSDAMIHHQLGNIFSKRGKRPEAILHQEKAITLSPNLASAHYQLGQLYTQENRLEDAISAYQTAYNNDLELIEALYNLAQVHRRNGNNEAARQKMQLFEKRKAEVQPIRKLKGALQRTPEQTERARILANIGRLYLKSKMYEKSVQEYEKALALNPQVIEAYNGIGIAYVNLKRYSDAITAQQQALKINPDFAEAHAGLGLAYLMQNRNELALKHYKKAITLSNNKPNFEEEIHHKIGIILLNQENYTKAALSFQAALSLNHENIESHHNLGICYAHQEKTTDALTHLKNAVEIAQNHLTTNKDNSGVSQTEISILPETFYLMGELYSKQKNYDEAKSAYLSSGLPKAYDSLAQLTAKHATNHKQTSLRTEILETAGTYAQSAIKLDPNKASYHNTYALICFRKGDYNTAETSIRKAISLDPSNPNYQEGLKHIQMTMSQQK